MGSTFTTKRNATTGIGKLFGNTSNEEIYLQFVPGIVLDVVVNYQSAAYTTIRDINSIIAKSHVTNDVNFDSVTRTRYYPLLRGMVDVPTKGDPVLLCTFGGVNYYLGPISPMNNPNFSIDHLNVPNYNLGAGGGEMNMKDKLKISKNFTTVGVRRLQKVFNSELDGPPKGIPELHGDLIYEGRHGNSIRIGSRDVNPYIMISNGRNPSNIVESNMDGSIFAMLDNGSIHQHFMWDSKVENGEVVKNDFILASDTVEKTKRLVGDENYNYKYIDDQVLLNSKKITFNAKSDNLTLSSFGNTLIGSGNELKIITNNSTTIESSNIYLGKQAQEEKEPMVLGNQLKIVLEEIVGIIEGTKMTACVAGLSGPVDPATLGKIQSLKSKLSSPKFWSEYHFIEDNGQKT
ncbi:MAG: hypothetical protein H8D94_00960 [Candidatus Pelagibacter sp.]|nr:hypothetical protein [Candidatus Pelagibacter sp.]